VRRPDGDRGDVDDGRPWRLVLDGDAADVDVGVLALADAVGVPRDVAFDGADERPTFAIVPTGSSSGRAGPVVAFALSSRCVQSTVETRSLPPSGAPTQLAVATRTVQTRVAVDGRGRAVAPTFRGRREVSSPAIRVGRALPDEATLNDPGDGGSEWRTHAPFRVV
jgi:hypothetical protein